MKEVNNDLTSVYGQMIRSARKERDLTPDEFAETLHVSRSLTEKWETGDRQVMDAYRRDIAETLDSPELYFQTWKESTGFVSLPYLNGRNIDHHPSAMKHMALREVEEALHHMDHVCWVKPADVRKNQEREDIKRVIFELLDAATTLINLVAVLVRKYDFSMKRVFRDWRLTVKARGWKQ
ncbi:helix-turn-helix transcriptional regulator [Bacillus sp. A116_S68]|nr:helix-turn-helix transcriptional regulator [Bacillus sp. A116_S68]